jgi:hypothetical protein
MARKKLTARQKARIAHYERAAERIQTVPEFGGCCMALNKTGSVEEAIRMAAVYRDPLNTQQRPAYWMAEYTEDPLWQENSELRDRRILALCFMMALIETGDA